MPVRELGQGQGMEVIDGNAVALHDVAGDLVVSLGFLGLARGLKADPGRGGCGKDQMGSGLLQALGNLFQILTIAFQRNLNVPHLLWTECSYLARRHISDRASRG